MALVWVLVISHHSVGGRRVEGLGVLELFHPIVAQWFRGAFGRPTPPQALGWPPIAKGEHTLILAPTGSGKTLAAFLYAIDELIRRPQGEPPPGVHILYISPLKALGYDIERNLQVPLAGIREVAIAQGIELPDIRVGVRTGDTSSSERQRLVRRPPHILITTPESLHLMLTSPRARETLRTVRYVIVDEIHALAPNKRGTFLSVLLERLEDLCGRPFQRIGLSATIRPLTKVARFLGGYRREDGELSERAVRVVDAGMRKKLDIKILAPLPDMTALPEGTIWPAIYQRLLELIQSHRSTIVFTGSRRAAERITAELNELAGYEVARVHHGSVAKEVRRELEQQLKAGELPALVATASLELGIDMGLVDLVCQVESPRSVARALQRVGRAGHVFCAASKGRLIPKTRADLLEIAAVAWGMRKADIAPVRIPENPLDILAQQIVAIVAAGPIPTKEVYRLLRRAYPYRDLPEDSFRKVVEMLAGRSDRPGLATLRPRISWDPVHDVLHPLPGTRHHAITGGGAIPDTGQYGVHTLSGDRIGELDEEFVYETRVGDVIVLGTNRWRVEEITHDRVIVAPADGPARLPFWRGELYSRDAALGRRVGALARVIEGRLGDPGLVPWLVKECALEEAAAENLVRYIADQHEKSFVPTDRRIVMEGFPDEASGLRVALLTPFGGRFHLALRLALHAAFRRRLSITPESLHSEAGILLRLTGVPFSEVLSVIRSVRTENVEELLMEEVAGSALFGLRFRQNAARALLLPRRPGRRTPLWLQRLRARDLLEAARGEEDFPIVVETLREVLADYLPVEELKRFLHALEAGEIELKTCLSKAPSPFTSSLLFEFQAAYLYQWDEPKAAPVQAQVTREVIAALLGRDLEEYVDPEAVGELERRLEGRARTGAELAELVRRLGDLSEEELSTRASPEAQRCLSELFADGRLARLRLTGVEAPDRIVAGEDLPLFRAALAGDEGAQKRVIMRHAASRALVSLPELSRRYPFPEGVIRTALSEAELQRTRFGGEECWISKEHLETLRHLTLARRRRGVSPASPAAFQAFILRWQRRHPDARPSGPEGLVQVLTQLQGVFLPWGLWAGEALPARVEGFRREWLEGLLRSGELVWAGRPGPGRELFVTFLRREDFSFLRAAYPPEEVNLSSKAQKVRSSLKERGASFPVEVASQLGMPSAQVALALWELARAGLVTSDGLEPLLAGPPPPRPGKLRVWQGSKGRWALIPPPGKLSEKGAEALARLLLSCYGILARQILALDGAAVPWGDLYRILSRMEWRGEVARGAFVQGLAGAQFAQEEVLRQLREADERWAILSACDPAVVWGTGGPFPLAHPLDPTWRLRRTPGNYLVLRDGLPVLAVEAWGQRLTGLVELSSEELRAALALLPQLLSGPVRRVRIRTWNGKPVRETPVEEILSGLGFSRDPEAMILYRKFGSR